jgi:predicted RNase H-like HicB family nuclease
LVTRVHIVKDDDSDTYWAKSPDLGGLVVSGATLDEVTSEAVSAADELLALQLDKQTHPRATTRFTYQVRAFGIA